MCQNHRGDTSSPAREGNKHLRNPPFRQPEAPHQRRGDLLAEPGGAAWTWGLGGSRPHRGPVGTAGCAPQRGRPSSCAARSGCCEDTKAPRGGRLTPWTPPDPGTDPSARPPAPDPPQLLGEHMCVVTFGHCILGSLFPPRDDAGYRFPQNITKHCCSPSGRHFGGKPTAVGSRGRDPWM